MIRIISRRFVGAGWLIAGLLLGALPPVGRGDEPDIIDVPLFYDVLKGANIPLQQGNTLNDQMKVLTKLINVIMDRTDANIEFTTVDQGIRTNRAPPGGGDTSMLSEAQRKIILNNGAKRLKDDNGDKGLLLVMAQQANKDKPFTLGVCYQSEPVGIITAGSVFGIDATCIHEIGHSLTLDHVDDKANLMYKDAGSGDKFNMDQIATLRKEALKRGKVKTKPTPAKPAENKPQALGITLDPDGSNAAVPDFQNVFSASIRAFGDEPQYQVRVDLAGLVPTAGAATSYRMLFNTDQRNDTGALIDGHVGVDQILRIDLNDAGVPSYTLQNAVTLSTVPLTGTMTRRLEFQDAEGGTPEFAEPHHDDFEIALPKSLLPLSGGRFFDIPVLASAGASPTDQFDLGLDLQYELAGPQLAADVGLVSPLEHIVHLTGSNFAPDSWIDIFASGTLLQTVNADTNGGFFATIDLPADELEGRLLYFNAVQQSTTDFGFTAVVVVPEPSTLCLLLTGAALLGARSLAVRRTFGVRRRAAAFDSRVLDCSLGLLVG